MKTSQQVVKLKLFVCFLEEMSAWKNHFEFVWPLDKKHEDGWYENCATKTNLKLPAGKNKTKTKK